MTRTRIVALITVLVIIFSCFTSCGLFNKKDQGTGDTGNNNENQGNVDSGSQDEDCSHATTKLVGEKAATCVEKGYTGDKVCTACTAIVAPGSETPTIDHVFDDGAITKNPTCIETGVMTFTCSGCGTTKTESLATTEHDDVYHDAQDGTHFHTCTKCTLDEQGEHTPTDEGTFVAATCTEPSHTLYTCAECDGVYKVYDGNDVALDHELGEWVEGKTATCVASGRKTQYCTREGCDYSHSVTVNATGVHTMVFSEYLEAPLCNADGVALYSCKYCTHSEQRAVAKTGVHNYVELENTGDGWNRKQCSACQHLISSFDASYLKEAELTTETINKEEALEVNVESAAIQFPKEVVGQITSGSDVAVSAGILDEEVKSEALDKITDEEQKAVLENANIYDFTVKVDGETFSQNFDGKVAITLSYDNGDGDEDGIVIYYLAENGEIETITDVVYNPETKEVTFFVSHFSYYAVAYRETQAMRCNRGVHTFEATDKVIEPTCYSFGYTVYKCSYCQIETIDDMVGRVPHKYGNEIAANPGCDRADYVTRVCQNEGCHDVLKVKLVGATGHKIKAPADCENHAVCHKCGEVVTLAFGHNWTAWEVVVAPTAVKTGLRRRYCVNCGNKEESVLAASGNIETINYDSYDELLEVLLSEVLKLDSGNITLKFAMTDNDGVTTDAALNIDVMKDDNGHRVYAKFNAISPNWTNDLKIYYDNGVMLLLSDESESSNGVLNFDALFSYSPIGEFKESLEDLYTDLDVVVEKYLTEIRSFLETYLPVYGDEINKLLANAECDYDVYELIDTINSIETVYAYLSLRLGYASAQQMIDGVVLPTDEDIRKCLEAFMEVTEENGNKVYTLSTSPILDAASEVLDFIDERREHTLAEVIYEVIEDYVLELDPTLVSFDAVMNYIAKEFPGSFTVSDAINKYIDFAGEKNLPSIKSLYSLVDTVAMKLYNQDIDSEKIIKKNRKMTLNELLRQMSGSDSITVQDLYDVLADNAHTTKFGDLPYQGATIGEIVDHLLGQLDSFPVTGDITITLDADGRLVSVTVDGDFNSDNIYYDYVDFKLNYDDSVKVEVPESLQDKMVNPDTSFDKDGNLIISNLPDADDYTLNVSGYARVPLGNLLKKDDTVSAEMGRDVYVLDREYWTTTDYVGTYVEYNGKYYEYHYNRDGYVYSLDNAISYEEAVSKLVERADNNMYYSGYTLVGRGDVDVYENYSGLIRYEKDGVTYYSNSYYRTYEGFCVYDEVTEDELTSLVKVTEGVNLFGRDGYIEIDGELVSLTGYYLSFGNNGSMYFKYVSGNDVYLFEEYSYSRDLIVIDSDDSYVTELPEHDRSNEYSITNAYVKNADGSFTKIEATEIYLNKLVPTYYYKISDKYYISIDEYYLASGISVSKLETMKLPDGNTLYILGTNKENSHTHKHGYELVYGYVEIADGLYVKTIAPVNKGEVVNVYYRNAVSNTQVSFGELNVDKYLTKNADGSYTISKDLVNKLNKDCSEYGYYSMIINGSFEYNGKTMQVAFGVSNYYNRPDISSENLDYEIWYEIFNNAGEGDHPNHYEYNIEFNNDGSITLVFANGTIIRDLYYREGIEVSVEDELKYDQPMSDSTGFNIYSYTGTYESGNSTGDHVYKDGKYYSFYHEAIYDFTFDESYAPTTWYIYNMIYRFDTIGSGELPELIPIYETEIRFNFGYYDYYFDSVITAYTIVVDGKIYALTEATVTGESLLTFEGWTPLNDYMAALEFVADEDSAYNTGTVNYNGQDTDVYKVPLAIYETDGNGNRLSDTPKYTIRRTAILENGAKKYIKSYSITYMIALSGEVDLSYVPNGAERKSYTETYGGVEYEMVNFYWTTTETFTAYYIKLAGSYYRYDYVDKYEGFGSFQYNYLDEWEFNNQALSKVWYYVVVDRNTGEERYYTEFIPSDYGFTPSGSEVYSWNIDGELYSQTLLGYTAEGNPMYEYAYWVNESSDQFEYTTETQNDGTVFYHVSGKGYLKVTDKWGTDYYVPARKVTNADGTTEILCLLMGARLTSNETNNFGKEILNSKYIKVKDNTVTLKKHLVAAILSNYREYEQLEIMVEYSNGMTDHHWIEYHDILSWFNSN